MDLQQQFDRAMALTQQGEYGRAAECYEAVLREVERLNLPHSQRAQVVRSTAFNLAQVYNMSANYEQALRRSNEGLGLSPSAYGLAIGLSAKGEALCGLGRVAEGQQAFDDAAAAHPVVGRLNAADSLTRLDSPDFWAQAEQRVEAVLVSFSHMLEDHWRAEAETILGKTAARRGEMDEARRRFDSVVQTYPAHASDARLQLRRLQSAPLAGQRRGFWQSLFGRK